MISEVIFNMRSTCFESQLGALDTKLGTRWPCLYFFLPHNVCFMLWNWYLLSRFLYCDGNLLYSVINNYVGFYFENVFSMCCHLSDFIPNQF